MGSSHGAEAAQAGDPYRYDIETNAHQNRTKVAGSIKIMERSNIKSTGFDPTPKIETPDKSKQ